MSGPGRRRFLFLLIGILAFGLTELGRYVYRPWAYRHHVADFGLADSIGNLGGIVVQIFLGLAVLNPTRTRSHRLAAFFAAGYVLYEFVQPYLPKGVFDWGDVVATGIGYGISAVLLTVVWRQSEPADVSDRGDRGAGKATA